MSLDSRQICDKKDIPLPPSIVLVDSQSGNVKIKQKNPQYHFCYHKGSNKKMLLIKTAGTKAKGQNQATFNNCLVVAENKRDTHAFGQHV